MTDERMRQGSLPENAQHIARYIGMGKLAYVLQQVHDKREAHPETPRLHLKENAEEERLEWLRADRDAGYIDGSTEELKIVASLPTNSPESAAQAVRPLTPEQKKTAERLEKREKEQREERNIRDSMRHLGGRRPAGGQSGHSSGR